MVGIRVQKQAVRTMRVLVPVAFVISTLAALAIASHAAQAAPTKTRAVTPAMGSFLNFVHSNHAIGRGPGGNPYTSQQQILPDPRMLIQNAAGQRGVNPIINGPVSGNNTSPGVIPTPTPVPTTSSSAIINGNSVSASSSVPGTGPVMPAGSSPSAPMFSGTTSRYVVQADLNNQYQLAQEGCNQSANGEMGVVILDFGQPWRTDQGAYGTLITDHPDASHFVSMNTIASEAEEFLWGYWQCATGNEALALGIGTNNAGSRFDAEHGYAWAVMVNTVNGWIGQENFQSREYAAAASDIELEYNSASATENWVNSYISAAQSVYFDYGDASGCPTTDTPTNQPCSHNWMQSDVLAVASGNGDGVAFPEIYNTTGSQARQWQSLSYLAHMAAGPDALPILGLLTQYGACHSSGRTCDPTTDNTPQQAWQEFYSVLNSSQVTAQPLPFVSDITWDS